jgi:hypothetical protein
MPTPDDLKKAHELYEEHEGRTLFYRVALDLVERARRGETQFSIAEAVALVLQTWNRRFYVKVHGGKFTKKHFAAVEALLEEHAAALDGYHQRSVESLVADDQADIEKLFDEFDNLVGPVGAAKAFHVLAPEYFPLWDRGIASGAGYSLGKRGTNANRYWRWMLKTQEECADLGGLGQWGPGLPKLLDEFNYCHYTLKLL